MKKLSFIITASLVAAACQPVASDAAPASSSDKPFDVAVIADFDEPWAMTFVPGSNRALVTEKKGKLLLWEADGPVVEITGIPTVAYGGQGGLGDVILHPDFANNQFVYLSYAEPGEGGFGAAVARAKLDLTKDKPALSDVQVICGRSPKFRAKAIMATVSHSAPTACFISAAATGRNLILPRT